MKGLQQKTSKFEVKDFDDTTRMVKGYASVFNNTDSDDDVILKGSYNKSIKEWGPEGKDRIKLVAQHDISRPVARITELKEDSNGLYMEASFGSHTLGDDYYRMTKEGIINEFSVGFVPIEKKENDKGGYDISNIKLYEVSMVTIAANDQAVVTDVKANDALKLVKQVGDDKLQFKLEREILRLMSEKQEITTETESDGSSKDSSEQEIVEPTLAEELNKIFNNPKI